MRVCPEVVAEYKGARNEDEDCFESCNDSPVASNTLEDAIKLGHHALAKDGFASLDAYDILKSPICRIYLQGLMPLVAMDFVFMVVVGVSGKNTSIK